MHVEKKRHIAKTVSYRIVSTLIGFIIMWFVSGSVSKNQKEMIAFLFITISVSCLLEKRNIIQ
jgi:hypothetical protein